MHGALLSTLTLNTQAMNCLTEMSVTQRFSSVSKQLRQNSLPPSLRRMGPTCLLCRTRFTPASRT